MSSARSERPVVFLDRDGTLNVKAPEGAYVRSWDEFAWLPDALPGLAMLTRAGCRLVVVTNQRGVALGHMSMTDVDDIHRRMRAEAAAHGSRIEAVYACPHFEGTCDCRKPRVGMLLRAQAELGLGALHRAAMVGDAASDVQAGRTLGLTTVLIEPGGSPRAAPADHVAANFRDAAAWLLRRWELGTQEDAAGGDCDTVRA